MVRPAYKNARGVWKFTGPYVEWRAKRITMLTHLVGGERWFNGKTVLELGCGLGHVGEVLRGYGAFVSFCEGHGRWRRRAQNRLGQEVIQLDQDRPWDLGQVFDLVVHWGVLYHLDDWRRDLRTALRHGRLLCLDTEVADSPNPDYELKVQEGYATGSIYSIGTRPSRAAVEKVLREENATFHRVDDPALDCRHHIYSWSDGYLGGQGEWKAGYNRFWFVRTGNA